MKKILLFGLILAGAAAYAHGEYTYSPQYVQHLKACAKYTDEYTTNVQTGDVKSPYLKLKSTEEVIGWLNGKCLTKSTVYSYDLDKVILKIKCSIPRAEVYRIVEKMKRVNSEGSNEARKDLQTELTTMIEDTSTCRVKNYLEE